VKQEIDPKVAAGVVAIIVVIAGVAVWAGTAGKKEGKEPPGMPSAAAAEFQKRMQGAGVSATGPGANSGPGRGAGYLAPPGPPGGAPR
jgi:hypothetical protein